MTVEDHGGCNLWRNGKEKMKRVGMLGLEAEGKEEEKLGEGN